MQATPMERAPWMRKSLGRVVSGVACSWGSYNADVPAPASEAVGTVQSGKDTGGDQTGETGGDHVAGVEDGHAGGDLFFGVEEGQ